MIIKRLAALTGLGALLLAVAPALFVPALVASTTAPVPAATTATGSVTVEWNYAITATLNMYTQTTASKTHTAPASNDVYWASDPAGASDSGCEGTTGVASAGEDTSANGTVNFGNVAADSTDYADCLESNAVDAYAVTNDSSGFTLAVQLAGNPTMPTDYDTAGNGGSLLCLIPTSTWSTTGNTAWATGRTAAVSENSTIACPTATQAGVPLTTTSTQVLSTTAATTGSDYNSDLQLQMAPQMVSGQQDVTLTYTLTTK